MSPHGTLRRYNNGKCRCHECRSASSRVWEERKTAYATGYPQTCQCCGAKGQVFWDHNHETEKHRGWLCRGCNSLIGYFKDDPTLLERAAQYLEESL